MSKKHQVLQDAEARLNNVDIFETVKAGGNTFLLKYLNRQEETAARDLTGKDDNVLTALLNAFSDKNLSQLAYAIQSVDDVPVSELFAPSTDDEKEEYEADPRRWPIGQMREWLSQRVVIVDQLWSGYLRLEDRVKKAVESLEDFSNKTPSGQ